jgi:hypothetical protein
MAALMTRRSRHFEIARHGDGGVDWLLPPPKAAVYN